MNISRIVSKTRTLVSNNSPVILTAIGVTGTLTTAYLAGKASWNASRVVRNEEAKRRLNNPAESPESVLTNREKFDMVWKLYIPAVTTGAATCTSIIFANRIGTKRAAALATAYSLSERAYAEYREKVVDEIGKEKDENIRKEIAKERIAANPPTELFLNAEGGKVLCHDAYTGRYFLSSKNDIEQARNEINYQINKSDTATLADFYQKVGLEPTSVSDEMGWNSEKQLEILWAPTVAPDGRPALSYDFAVVPIREFWRFR